MSIRIDQTACIGCGRCKEACPGNLITLNAERRAQIRDVRDCWGCTSCMKDCPVHAISFYLGADIGGDGTLMRITRRGELYDWQFTFPDGRTQVITVDRTRANQY